MKTLPTNISNNYLLTSSRPRLFINIANAGKSWATTKDLSGFTNRIYKGVSISEKVDNIGGMSIVSDANLSVLKLGESIKFYDEVIIYPRPQGVNVGAGYIYSSSGLSYLNARNSTVGTNTAYSSFIVGQNLSGSTFYVYRGYLQFNIPYTLTSCEDAYIDFTFQNESLQDFSFKLLQGNWAIGSIGLPTFKNFYMWEASGEYVEAYGYYKVLNEPQVSSDEPTTTTRLRFNKAGRDIIVSKAGLVLELMLISENDRVAQAPTTGEYITFSVVKDSTPSLKLIYNTVLPDNQRARIYLGFEDKLTALPNNIPALLNVWSGVVDEWGFTEKELALKLRHDDFKYNRKLTTNILTTDEFPNLPDENVGKPKLIVFGDFTSTVRNFKEFIGSFIEKQNEQRIESTDFFKAYLFKKKKTAIGFDHYFVSEYALSEVKKYGALWESSIKNFVILPCIVTEFATGQYLVEPGGGFFPYNITGGHYPETALAPILAKLMHYSSNVSVPDYANSQDSDPTNWTTINSSSDEWKSVNYTSWGAGSLLDVIAFVIEVEAPYGYGYNYLKFHHKVLKEDNSELDDGTESIAVNGQKAFYLDHTALPDSKVNVLITITGDNTLIPGVFDASYPIKFRNVCIFRGFSSDIGAEIFLTGKGIKDTSGDYTGIVDTLIENPVSLIKWFAMEKGTLTSSQIDDSFIDSFSDLSAWKFAFQWSGDLNINNVFPFGGNKSIIGELAKQCKSTVIWNNLGKLEMNVFNISNPFPHSLNNIPNNLDIFELSGSPDATSITKHPIYSYNMELVSLDEVYNDFVLKYGQNYASNDYNSVLYMKNGTGTIPVDITDLTNMTESYLENSQTLANLAYYTSHSYNVIHTTNTLEFKAWAIRDEATANKLLQYLIEWYTKRRWIILLTTGLNALCFEIGDFINVRIADVQYQFGVASMNVKKWKITGIEQNLAEGKMKLEVIESETY